MYRWKGREKVVKGKVSGFGGRGRQGHERGGLVLCIAGYIGKQGWVISM